MPFRRAGVVWGDAAARGAPCGSASAEHDPQVVDAGAGAPLQASGKCGQLADHASSSCPLSWAQH
jgi:hypothetical protein